jgi:hypothetical protein
MMQAGRVQDAIHRGLGRAGLVVGEWCELFRPEGGEAPLAAARRVLRLVAAFTAQDGRFAKPPTHGQVYWLGLFDAAYTRPGDYIRRGDGAVWFIAAQPALHPVLCVRANRVIDVVRPVHAAGPGLAPYGGGAAPEPVLRAWPVSMVRGGGAGLGEAALPEAVPGGGWLVLLPAVAGVVLREGDLVRDDLGRSGVIAQAELSEPGWRLIVRRAGS